MNRKSFFWASYADLMTSLFFIMLVLFVLTVIMLQKNSPDTTEELKKQIATLEWENADLKEQLKAANTKIDATQSELNKIREIQNAISNISPDYFAYNSTYKKHVLKMDARFPIESYDMKDIPIETRRNLVGAGREIKNFISDAVANNPGTQYLLIIEGQASRDRASDVHNYNLSYQRAFALWKFWQEYGIHFNPSQCEVIIAGSGTEGVPRDKTNEEKNQRFLIHILPKPGIIK